MLLSKISGLKQEWMIRVRRICAIFLIITLQIIGLSACANGTKVIFTTGFGKDEVFRIEDESCKKNELMVYLTNIQNQYESVYGKGIWQTELDGVTLEENVKETVLARIAQIKTMYLLAGAKGIVLDEDEKERVAKAADEYYSSLDDVEITALDISKSDIEKMYIQYALANKVYNEIIKDVNPEISDDEARTIKVQQIFFSTIMRDGSGKKVDYSEREKLSVYEKACDVRELALEGERDFEDLASQYSDDNEITISFGKGEVDAQIEDAAFKLETGEISRVVESDMGYYIIKCISTFDREETDANKIVLGEKRKDEVFGQEYDAFVNTLVRSLNEELWNEISLIHSDDVTTIDFFDVYDKYFAAD